MSSLIFPTILMTLISLVAWIFMLILTDPSPNNKLAVINLIYFFLTAFLFLAGAFTLMLYWLGNFRLKKTRIGQLESIHKPRLLYSRSLRHGLLLAVALVGTALLKALDFANPLNIILLVSALILIEIYFFGH